MNLKTLNKVLSSLLLTYFLSFSFLFGQTNSVNFTFKLNDKSQTTQVDGQEFLNKINPLIDSLNLGIDSSLNTVQGWDSLTNENASVTEIGLFLNLNNKFNTTGINNFNFTINSFSTRIPFLCNNTNCNKVNVIYSVKSIVLTGKMDSDSKNVQNYLVTINGDSLFIIENGNTGSIDDSIKIRLKQDIRTRVVEYLTQNKPFDLLSLLTLFFNDFNQTNNISQLTSVLKIPNISTKNIVITYNIDLLTGESEFILNYENPYSGMLVNRDNPPIRGLMFSGFNMKVTKLSLGFTGGDLTHYDNVTTDDLQFFQFLDSLNIKFIRSEISWGSVEPSLEPINIQNTVDKYISDRAQLFNNLETHYQFAKQFLYDFVVSIGDGHSTPKDASSNKTLWIGNENSISAEDIALGFDSNNFSFITKQDYLSAIERHIRAVVRRLKNVINFWQIENELNQADLELLTNTQSSFKRNGSAWLHIDFLDQLFNTMVNSIKTEDPTARITHNFHPFRISKIKDWGNKLDIIGLTYQPNFQFAFPRMGFTIGEIVKIAYQLLGNASKPVWILSAGYPSAVNGGNANWDFSKNFKNNFLDFNTARQVEWVNNALLNSGSEQADGFLYRTYQAQNPDGPLNTKPSSFVGLVFPDGTKKDSHDQIINSLSILDFVVDISGPDTISSNQPAAFTANPAGGVVQTINGMNQYTFYKWERKNKNGSWEGVDSGAQKTIINQSGNDDFSLRCTVTDYYGNKQISNELFVKVDNVTGIETSGIVPSKIELIGNYPNPFNPTTNIKYAINEQVNVSINIYNTLGQKIKTLIDKFQTPGFYTINWDGKNDLGGKVSSAVYIYRLNAGKVVETKKMVLLR